MAIPRGKPYYIEFIVYDKSSLPDGRISGIGSDQFTILWWKDDDTMVVDISDTIGPTLAEVGTGRYRFLLGSSLMDGDRISLEIKAPNVPDAYIIPMTIYTTPSSGGLPRVVTDQNLDKAGYTLAQTEHTQIADDTRAGLTAQGYTTTRADRLDNLDATISSRPLATDIWGYPNRSLTDTQNIANETWSFSTRTLTGLGDGLVDEIWNRGRDAVPRPVGSFGGYLDEKISSRATTDGVWSHSTRTLTSFGTLVSDIWAHSSRTLTSFGTLVSDIWSHSTRTLTSFGTLVSDIWEHSSRTLTSFGTLVSDIWSHTIEAGRSATWAMRIILSCLVGKVYGAETNTPRFRDIGDTKDRINMTVDDYGNRSGVTLDGD